MPITFDEMGVGNCPGCKAYVCQYDRFCDSCGIALPLPEKVLGQDESIEAQLDADDITGHEKNPVTFHWQYLKFKANAFFCPSCGKRIRKTPEGQTA